MAGKIFINYRRGDDPGTTGRLFDRLQDVFDPQQLFLDVDNIPPGRDFVRELNDRVAECDIVLAVMASLAKIERQKISERTRAGMERVRQHGSKSGKAIGRPSISDRIRTRIVEMLAAGTGIRATARAVGTGNETVHRIAREMRMAAVG